MFKLFLLPCSFPGQHRFLAVFNPIFEPFLLLIGDVLKHPLPLVLVLQLVDPLHLKDIELIQVYILEFFRELLHFLSQRELFIVMLGVVSAYFDLLGIVFVLHL
jgi:hypothetical protein